ncbi:MAG: Flp pilus assembly protein CpaB [Candidatus Obscuribacterales bacterium]|nr:Flp pilus assembly protein CpaB [Candidatus Obscuribacterales bacterium]
MAQITTPERPQIFSNDRLKSVPASPRKRNNMTAIVFGSLVLLLLVVGIARMAMNKPDPQALSRTRVVAAAHDILPGVPVGFHDVRYMEIPNEYVIQGMFEKSNLAVGRVSKVFIAERNPLQDSFFYPADKSMSYELETHERAITVKLNEAGLVDHQLTPGDKVDVLVTATKDGKKYTKTICQNVKVLMAANRAMLQSNSAGRAAGAQNRITLALSPDQAELVTHAEDSGTIKLAMRSRLSVVESKLPGVSEMDLLPAKAMLQTAPTITSSAASSLIPAPPELPVGSIPDLPPMPSMQDALPPVVKDSVKWVVEMFSGSKKELYEVQSSGQ